MNVIKRYQILTKQKRFNTIEKCGWSRQFNTSDNYVMLWMGTTIFCGFGGAFYGFNYGLNTAPHNDRLHGAIRITEETIVYGACGFLYGVFSPILLPITTAGYICLKHKE